MTCTAWRPVTLMSFSSRRPWGALARLTQCCVRPLDTCSFLARAVIVMPSRFNQRRSGVDAIGAELTNVMNACQVMGLVIHLTKTSYVKVLLQDRLAVYQRRW